MNTNRRRFLLGSAAAGTALLAGCSSLPNTQTEPLPGYHSNIPAGLAAGETVSYLDVAALFRMGYLGEGTATETATPTPRPSDGEPDPAAPLLSTPVAGSLLVVVFGLGFGLLRYGAVGERLAGQFDQSEADSAADLSASSVLFTPTGVVVEGTFDQEAYVEDLPAAFSEVGTHGDFTLFADAGENPAAIAISEAAIVFQTGATSNGTAPEAAVEHLLDTRAGEAARLTDENPDVAWALRTAGSHGFAVVTVGDTTVEAGQGERAFDPVAGTPLADVATSVLVSGASIRGEDGSVTGADADTALTHTDEPVERSAVADAYEGSDAEVTVTVSDGDADGSQRVHVSAAFDQRSFEV